MRHFRTETNWSRLLSWKMTKKNEKLRKTNVWVNEHDVFYPTTNFLSSIPNIFFRKFRSVVKIKQIVWFSCMYDVFFDHYFVFTHEKHKKRKIQISFSEYTILLILCVIHKENYWRESGDFGWKKNATHFVTEIFLRRGKLFFQFFWTKKHIFETVFQTIVSI